MNISESKIDSSLSNDFMKVLDSKNELVQYYEYFIKIVKKSFDSILGEEANNESNIENEMQNFKFDLNRKLEETKQEECNKILNHLDWLENTKKKWCIFLEQYNSKKEQEIENIRISDNESYESITNKSEYSLTGNEKNNVEYFKTEEKSINNMWERSQDESSEGEDKFLKNSKREFEENLENIRSINSYEGDIQFVEIVDNLNQLVRAFDYTFPTEGKKYFSKKKLEDSQYLILLQKLEKINSLITTKNENLFEIEMDDEKIKNDFDNYLKDDFIDLTGRLGNHIYKQIEIREKDINDYQSKITKKNIDDDLINNILLNNLTNYINPKIIFETDIVKEIFRNLYSCIIFFWNQSFGYLKFVVEILKNYEFKEKREEYKILIEPFLGKELEEFQTFSNHMNKEAKFFFKEIDEIRVKSNICKKILIDIKNRNYNLIQDLTKVMNSSKQINGGNK